MEKFICTGCDFQSDDKNEAESHVCPWRESSRSPDCYVALKTELDEYVNVSRRLAIERAELRRQRDGLKAELEKLLDVLPPHVLVAPGEIGKQIAAAREALKLEIL